MSTFCGSTGTAPPSMTLNEQMQIYTNGLLPSQLPDMDSGLAEDSWVSTYVEQLMTQGRVPRPDALSSLNSNPYGPPEGSDPLAQYVQKENELTNAIKAEYCFYETRYFSALDSFLQAVAAASLNDNAQNTVQDRLNILRNLNKRLILLTQIANTIAKKRYQSKTQFQSQINTVNAQLTARRAGLREQNEILSRETAAADLHRRMVEYTVEKNKANQNLLALYGVLNITAIAMIFYIART